MAGMNSLLESNVKILEQDCDVTQLFVEAATSRRDHLYLGLDISTQSTGYAVLQPSLAAMTSPSPSPSPSPLLDDDDDRESVDNDRENDNDHSTNDQHVNVNVNDKADKASSPNNKRREMEILLREVGEANLMEWGFISGNGSDGKKGDEVDVGVIVEDTLMRVAARCRKNVREGVCVRSSTSSSPTPSAAQLEREVVIEGDTGVEGEGEWEWEGFEAGGSAAAGKVCRLSWQRQFRVVVLPALT